MCQCDKSTIGPDDLTQPGNACPQRTWSRAAPPYFMGLWRSPAARLSRRRWRHVVGIFNCPGLAGDGKKQLGDSVSCKYECARAVVYLWSCINCCSLDSYYSHLPYVNPQTWN